MAVGEPTGETLGTQIVDLYQTLFDVRRIPYNIPTIDTAIRTTFEALLVADPPVDWPNMRNQLGAVAFQTLVQQESAAEDADERRKQRRHVSDALVGLLESNQGAKFIVTSLQESGPSITVTKGGKKTISQASSGFINLRTIDAFREEPSQIQLGLLSKNEPTKGHLTVHVINPRTKKPAIRLFLNP